MKVSSILKAVVIIIISAFVVHQVISSVYKPVDTESATYYTATEGIKINGSFLRKESLVYSNNSGVLHFVVADGERVAKGGAVANIYENEASSLAVSRLANLKEKIDDITDIMSYNDVDAVNIDLLTTKVNERLNGLILSTASGNYTTTAAATDALLSSLNRRQAALGINTDFSAQLEALNAEYNSISASLPASKGSIYADCSGYFVSKTDGFENVYTTSDLSAITSEFLSNAKAEPTGADIVGKIVSDYEWYIAAKVPINDSLEFKEGEELKIATSLNSAKELSVTVAKINISESDSTAVIIFYCNQMNSDLAMLRTGQMTVIKAKHEGLKVPRKALRVVDSVKGVYVLSGMELEFIPVEIEYYSDDYIICKTSTEDNSKSIRLYDKVVVKGKNLYDGKIVG